MENATAAQNPNSPEASAAPGVRAHAAPPTASTGLTLRVGDRIRLDWRKGSVEDARGGRERPYEVRVRWDGAKVPEYIVFETLARAHRLGRLERLSEG